jgi:DNA-binding transcriptional MerR regulator
MSPMAPPRPMSGPLLSSGPLSAPLRLRPAAPVNPPALRTLSIDQLARRTGLPVPTLRRMVDEGFISSRGRSPAGRQLFGEDTVWRVEMIRSLAMLGMTEVEIRRAVHGAGSGRMVGPELAGLLRRVQQRTRARMESDLRRPHTAMRGAVAS